MDAELTERDTECTCAYHSTDLGHAPGSTAFEVESVCPNCRARNTLRLCSGRVLTLLGGLETDQITVECPVCRTSGPAKTFWQNVGKPTGAPPVTSTCRPGRHCVGC